MTRPRARTPVKLTRLEWQYIHVALTCVHHIPRDGFSRTFAAIARKLGGDGRVAATRGVAPVKWKETMR
jgi:hypothetical protein